MTKPQKSTTGLRLHAEASFQKLAAQALATPSPEETRQALHELHVHQIELETQIEDLRASHAALNAARARYLDLYDLAPVGYCTLNEIGQIIEANLTLATLFGVDRGTLTKLPLSRFITKIDQDVFNRHSKKLLATGKAQNFELQMLTHDGTAFWTHLVTTATRELDGAPIIRIVLSDISEQKQSEAKLHKSEAFNLAILDSISAEVAVLDRNGIVIAANQPWRHFAFEKGIKPGDLVPHTKVGGNFLAACKKLDNLIPDGSMNVVDGLLAVMNGKLPSFDFDYLCSATQKDWYSMRATPMGDGAVITNTNITTLKRAELYEQFRRHLLERLAQDEPLSSLLEALVLGLEQLNPSMLCSILLLDQEGRHLGTGVAPSLPDFYNAAVDGIEIGPGVGCCGTAAFTGKRVVVEDIATHPYWAPYTALAARAGLAACWSQPIFSSSGKVLGTFAIYHHEPHAPTDVDIYIIEQAARLASIAIDKCHANEKLREEKEFFHLIAESIDDFIAVLDLDGRRLYNSPAYTAIFGTTKNLKGSDSFAEVHPDDRERVKQVFRETVETGKGQLMDYRFLTEGGKVRQMESFGSVIKNGAGQVTRVVVVSRDITERKHMEETVRHLAFYDPLTDLPNRRLLNDRLTQHMAASARSGCYGAVLFLDLDDFKPLNDLHGHDAGDLLLIEVAVRLKRCVREIDTVARFGGDELVIVIGDLQADKTKSRIEARLIAEKIRNTLSEPYQLTLKHGVYAGTDIEHRCTVSTGVVLFLNHETTHGDILKWADMAMYKAKKAGRNLIQFYDLETMKFE